MKSKWLTVVLVLSLAINGGVLVSMGFHYYVGASAPSTPPCPISPCDSHLYESLGLSKLQLSRMEPLAREFHGRLGELRTVMEKKKETLIDLLQKDRNPASIENLRKEMAGIQDEIQREVISHIVETKKILNAKQEQKFFDLMRQTMTRGQSPWSPANGGKR